MGEEAEANPLDNDSELSDSVSLLEISSSDMIRLVVKKFQSYSPFHNLVGVRFLALKNLSVHQFGQIIY
jgi:hypothetical protein